VSGYHGSNDGAISREVGEGLEPTSAIVFEHVPFEGGRVRMVNEFLEMFQRDLGRGRRAPQVPEVVLPES